MKTPTNITIRVGAKEVAIVRALEKKLGVKLSYAQAFQYAIQKVAAVEGLNQ